MRCVVLMGCSLACCIRGSDPDQEAQLATAGIGSATELAHLATGSTGQRQTGVFAPQGGLPAAPGDRQRLGDRAAVAQQLVTALVMAPQGQDLPPAGQQAGQQQQARLRSEEQTPELQ